MNVEGQELELLPEPPEPGKENVENKSKNKRKRKKKKKDNDEPKTRPPNSFGQFLKHKRSIEGKIDFKKACVEWKQMPSTEKGFYTHCFEEEKTAMGDGYRPVKSKKEKQELSKKAKKKSKIADKSQQKEESFSSLQLLTKVESIDSEISRLHREARQLQKSLIGEKVQLSLNQFKLEERSVECCNVKEKYQVLLTQHSSCLVDRQVKK